MRYLSVCAGIEAATVAWHDMGWQAAAYSEIEKFPCEVLKHHYPDVPNVGDMTKFEEWQIGTIDLLVGGTPCQSFSVAGLRKGLDDPRGNLMLTYGAIAKRFRPKWLVWENVPGVLSSNGGRDFGTFLGMLAELGYGFAYRVLDAQYFGVAQRRRRVFVVGCLGNWRAAAAVLFERDSLCGNSAPSRTQRERAPTFFESSLAQYRQDNVGGTLKASGGVLGGGSETFVSYPKDIPEVMSTLLSSTAGISRTGNAVTEHETYIPMAPIPYDLQQVTSSVNHQYARKPNDPCHTLAKENAHGSAIVQPIALAENTIGRQPQNGGNGDGFTDGGPMYTLNSTGVHGIMQPIGFEANMSMQQPSTGNVFQTLTRRTHASVNMGMAVRRLTPKECERLQGFPDNYTNIKTNCPDGPRYKALGNSMAVPVMKWIGQRIQTMEGL